ncbi:MAG: aquaporin [Coriobacteriales bacterium]|jgi:glycerol uptake facilitator protein|nr:aquaporin [Coriobacteriales bacterium]
MKGIREFLGEVIGTFLMVFFGVGAVAVTVLFGAHSGTFQVAIVWGITIALAIYATRNLSNAHFNSAVSLAMVISGRMPLSKLPLYVAGQLVGALAAAAAIVFLLGDSIALALSEAGGFDAPSAIKSVLIETYPNTAHAVVSMPVAFAAEALGVFFLVTLIFALTEGANIGRPDSGTAPLFIGLVVTVIICFVGPLTDAGLNPARDLGPRVIGALMGWGATAFSWDILAVYVAGPLVGATLAALALVFVIEPLTASKKGVATGAATKEIGE